MDHALEEKLKHLLSAVSNTGQMNISFSQLGEDRILWWMFGQRHNGFYVDIGCYHPYLFSNTALLHLRNGWHGINVDMDERAIAAFREARPDDASICAAIGSSAGQIEATMFHHGEFNTLDPNIGSHPSLAGFLMERRMVDVLPLGDILHANVPPGRIIDFMNIDIEGLDHAALASNDWDSFAPEAIAVEIRGFDVANAATNPTSQLLISKGYRVIAHLVSTTIFRRDIT